MLLVEYLVRLIFAQSVLLPDHVRWLVEIKIVVKLAMLPYQILFLLLQLQVHLCSLALVFKRPPDQWILYVHLPVGNRLI